MTEPDYTYRAKYVSNYDGDTVRFDIDLGFGVWLHNQAVRLLGIDTPEIKGDTREAGMTAKAVVEDELTHADAIMLKTEKDRSGKYGRWLATVYYRTPDGWTNLNKELLEKGLAEEYPV